jgi:hypothetical protein
MEEERMGRRLGLLVGVSALVLAAPGLARGADDDLSVVRRAVADARPLDAPAAKAAAPTRKHGEPQWLRVRIQEKREKKARVSVNLPLSFVKAIGSDWPLDGRCHRHADESHPCMTIGEALRTLESGQDIVQIDDEDSTVRVWVE